MLGCPNGTQGLTSSIDPASADTGTRPDAHPPTAASPLSVKPAAGLPLCSLTRRPRPPVALRLCGGWPLSCVATSGLLLGAGGRPWRFISLRPTAAVLSVNIRRRLWWGLHGVV